MTTTTPVTENPAVLDPKGALTKVQQNALEALHFYRNHKRILGGWQLGSKRVSTGTVTALIKSGLVRLSGPGLSLTQAGHVAIHRMKGKSK